MEQTSSKKFLSCRDLSAEFLKNKFKYTQNSYFRNYTKDQPESEKIKDSLLCIALEKKKQIKEILNLSNPETLELLNKVAKDIQELINQANFSETNRINIINDMKKLLKFNCDDKPITDYGAVENGKYQKHLKNPQKE
ncbi:MAG: hypothetical protein ACK5Z5_06500 [Neisseriaceae bacterium]